MLFSSLIFIWYFLPIVFCAYACIPNLKARNLLLLAASILFYAWGEPIYVLLMLVSITLNYTFGLLIDRNAGKDTRRFLVLACVAVNLLLLGYFKYFNFFAELVNSALHRQAVGFREIVLPVGISFYTFQALSYVVDVYRGSIRVQKNPLDLALYISFFPQLIAGPIVKYHDIQEQLGTRTFSVDRIAYGIKRFSYGLGKKVILANTFASVADRVFDLKPEEMGTGLIWFALLLYTLQIYFDFSGYSDMAIGLGRMFGFDFMENFNYPYISSSIKEFWRRWHISLSTWFREYLYIPLGGNRKGTLRTYVNLFIVFFATGLWHGAGGNFVLWGMYHGFFIVAERAFFGKILEKNPIKPLNHLYTLLVVIVGWLMFRVEKLGVIRLLLTRMFVPTEGIYRVGMFADNRIWFWTAAGLLLCGPVQAVWPGLRARLYDQERVRVVDIVIMAAIVGFCTLLLVNNTYNPFIYFRF